MGIGTVGTRNNEIQMSFHWSKNYQDQYLESFCETNLFNPLSAKSQKRGSSEKNDETQTKKIDWHTIL